MTKDEVLSILRSNDSYVSGEAISVSLGITRAAVNGAVKALKADGCVIDSVTNKGYRLLSCPDKLLPGDVFSYLPRERRKNVICLPTVDSTSNRLKEMLKDNPESGTCIIANEQTGGRGRLGRKFESPSDSGIYLSMLIRPSGELSDMSEITAWTAVAVHNAIMSAFGIETSIKWVNDLFIGSRKVCGILTELSVEGEIGLVSNVIVGIGINVNQKADEFPAEIADIATSLSAGTDGSHLDRARLAAQIILEMDKLISDWPSGKASYLETYRSSCITLGRDVTVSNYATGEKKQGRAIALNDDFSLLVEFEDGISANVMSGEVSVRF